MNGNSFRKWLIEYKEGLTYHSTNFLDKMLEGQLDQAIAIVMAVILISSTSAAAQVDEVGEAMCGYGIGDLITILFALIAILLMIKSAFQVMFGFDKLNSPREQEHFEGTKQITSAAWTFAGAFVPLLFAGLLDVIGVNTVSCLDFDIGILSIGTYDVSVLLVYVALF